jgi:hypothetical protein
LLLEHDLFRKQVTTFRDHVLAVNKQADDQRRKSKYAENAPEYRNQPNDPAMVVLDDLKG